MKTFTVSQINRIIKDLIDNEVILEDVTVTGELSSFSITRDIAYFTLKDNDNLLSCVQFNAKAVFNIGDLVQVQGNVKYYPKGGKLTFNALTMEHCGQGELYQQFIKLKEKLAKEGLFDDVNKVPLPRFINSIGVVTSKTGAVLQDIKNVSMRRNPNLEIYVYDAQVQGKMAVRDIIDGITYFDNLSDVDVIIVARGGGSIEDLSVFNDEELARVAYICNKPLISAVGHETDFTIIDFVADLRAPTPSAAAELVSFDCIQLKRYIKDLVSNCELKLNNQLKDLREEVNTNTLNIENVAVNLVNDQSVYITDLVNRLDKTINEKVLNTIHCVDIALNTLDRLNPVKLLQAGYSYVSINGTPISYGNINVEDKVDILAKDVKLTAKVVEKEKR